MGKPGLFCMDHLNVASRAERSLADRRVHAWMAGGSLVALVIATAGIATPQGAWAASGGNAISPGSGPAGPGGVGGTDGSAADAIGKSGSSAGGNTNSAGGGGATDLTTGLGAAGGASSLGGGLTTPGTSQGVKVNDNRTEISSTITADTGGAGAVYSGGGGGGLAVSTTVSVTVTASGKVTGGQGGNAGSSSGGGGGGVGIFSSADVTINAGGTVSGGAGGRPASGGGGGGGAASILVTTGGTVNNSGVLTGGAGGTGGNSTLLALVGAGGSGGEGVLLTNGGAIVNQAGASITGGNGGANGPKNNIYGASSKGGAAIKGANVSIVNAGSITGGLDGSFTYNVVGTTRANAITFTGGVNSLELRAGSVITGNVVAFSAADRFILGGDDDASFDASSIGAAAQYQNFGSYEKTGDSTWTLTGETTALTPWTLTGGTLSIAADGSLGDDAGALTFNGGTLRTTANISMDRAMVLQADGTIETTSGQLSQAGVISGAGSLTKTGAGDLGLSGINTYTGETVIEAGILGLTGSGSIEQSSRVVANGAFNIADATNGALIRSLAGSGTVELGGKTLTLTAAADEFSGDIHGSGGLTLLAGTQVLSGANNYSGDTLVSGGTLAAGATNALSAASNYTVSTGGTLDLAGFNQTLASLGNAGTVRFGGASGTTLTVTGDYASNGGTIEINTVLGDDNSLTDRLVVAGDVVLGTGATQVRVVNVGGAGAPTTGDGIRIIEVVGTSAADAFVLEGPAIAGAYRYNLLQNGVDTVDGDWYLRADGLAPTLPTYESYPEVMLGLIALPTLQQRVGDRRPGVDDKTGGNGLWTRIEGAHARVKADGSTTEASYDSDLFQLQVGVDGQLLENASGALIAGLTAQYSRASADVSSDLGNGSNTTEGYGIGANLTWYGANGVYVDSQAQFAWFDTDLSADGVGTLAEGNNGTGYALSVELGKELAIAPGWTVTPQAQLAYASVDFDDLTDPFGAEVSLRNGESLKGRVGAALGRDANWQDEAGPKVRSHVYGITSLTYEFLDGATVAVSGVDLVAEPQKFGAELGLGGTYNWADERFALHGEAVASTSFDGSYGYKGTLGLTVGF
jgi:outer membrane autotransporter protein